MADTGIFTTTAEVQHKAGANANTTANTETYINDFVAQAESLINADVTYNFSDNYAALNADVKGILKLAASAKAAMMVINYDLDAIGRSTATLMLNVLKDEYDMAIRILRDKRKQGFIDNA